MNILLLIAGTCAGFPFGFALAGILHNRVIHVVSDEEPGDEDFSVPQFPSMQPRKYNYQKGRWEQ